MAYLSEIKSTSQSLCRARFSDYIQQVRELRDTCPESSKKRIGKLMRRFDGYLDTLIVLGYNSAKYDLPLLKSYLFPILGIGYTKTTDDIDDETESDDMEGDDGARNPADDDTYYVIKRNNALVCVNGDNFKFLDVVQYSSAGLSYSAFLKSFQIKEEKSFFPYEFLTSVDQLDEKTFRDYYIYIYNIFLLQYKT